jgi:hypothetical protein
VDGKISYDTSERRNRLRSSFLVSNRKKIRDIKERVGRIILK